MSAPPIASLPPPRLRPADAPLPLAGVRVVDFSHFLSGPYCTQILADFGAEVWKIEKPNGGDDFARTSRQTWAVNRWATSGPTATKWASRLTSTARPAGPWPGT